MQTVNAKSGASPSSHILTSLVASQTITQLQAEWIAAIWPDLDADVFAHPYLRGVRDHTRTYLEAVARP